MSMKETMEKDFKLSNIVKYLKLLKPVWNKFAHLLGFLATNDEVMTILFAISGALLASVSLFTVLNSFHPFFFITIPLGILGIAFGVILVHAAALSMTGRVDEDKKNYDLSKWKYKVEENDSDKMAS